jgi:hypothetical protein
MTLVIACLLSLQTSSTSSHGLPAWIASLHHYERIHGRNEWSWKELVAARASVGNARLGIRHDLAWWNPYYTAYVQNHLVVMGFFTLLGIFLVAYCYRTGRRHALIISVMGWWIVAIAGMVALSPDRRQAAIIKPASVTLRIGNGVTYPPALLDGVPVQLSAGVEARYLGERSNGWVRIELKGNIVGWVPKDAVYLIE